MYIHLYGSGDTTLGQMPTQPEVRTRNTWIYLVPDLQILLQRPLRADDSVGIQERRRDLIRLFESLKARPWDAQELYARLFVLPDDPLGKLFHYRLATPTRSMLRRILVDIIRQAYTI